MTKEQQKFKEFQNDVDETLNQGIDEAIFIYNKNGETGGMEYSEGNNAFLIESLGIMIMRLIKTYEDNDFEQSLKVSALADLFKRFATEKCTVNKLTEMAMNDLAKKRGKTFFEKFPIGDLAANDSDCEEVYCESLKKISEEVEPAKKFKEEKCANNAKAIQKKFLSLLEEVFEEHPEAKACTFMVMTDEGLRASTNCSGHLLVDMGIAHLVTAMRDNDVSYETIVEQLNIAAKKAKLERLGRVTLQ